MFGVAGSNLAIFKLEPTAPNMSQPGGQTHATFCPQQCFDMLCWHVGIVWPQGDLFKKKKRNIAR